MLKALEAETPIHMNPFWPGARQLSDRGPALMTEEIA
jgi:hypothetical protein